MEGFVVDQVSKTYMDEKQRPYHVIVPLFGFSMPIRSRARVLFPLPLSPRTATFSPADRESMTVHI